jgi:dipeptidyl aminopeptidase/acylaminoacyl peptidase
VFLVQYEDGIFETNKIYSSRYSLSESICSPGGQFVCFVESGRKKNENILSLFSTKKHKRIIRVYFSEMIIPVAFSQNTQFPVLLCLLRVNSWLRPIFYDFKHNKIIKINHKEFRGDTWILSWFEKSNEMILLDIYQAQQRLYLYNYQTKKLQRIGPRTGSFSFNFDSVIHFQKNSKKFLIVKWSDFNNPSCLIRLKPPNYNTWNKIKKFSSNFSSKYKIKNIFTFSSDKKLIQAWIITPKTTKKQLPFVIDLHGGPHGVAMNEFSPEAQVWLRSGFGYCAVNYRGSISFGKDFEQKIYGNPGHWEVEDVVAVRNWLLKNKYADSKNIILYGWSWGGYIVLLALGKYPNLWCCGIAGSAIADWIMQYYDEPAYFKAQDKELFKGTPKTSQVCYLRSSPIFYANNIQSPILLLHGKNDVRCPPRQIKYFIKKLKKFGKDFSVIWFDSGHIDSFTNIHLRTQLMNKILKFVFNYKKTPLK